MNETPDKLYLAWWRRDYEASYVIAIARTREEAKQLIQQHLMGVEEKYDRLYYEIEERIIGQLERYYVAAEDLAEPAETEPQL